MHFKLGRKKEHRNALLRNIGISLVLNERVTTTLPKAKALRPIIERWITIAKGANLHAERILISRVGDKPTVSKLMKDLAKRNSSRPGGYTRILKLGARVGDASPTALIEFVEAPAKEDKKEEAKEKKSTEKSEKKTKKAAK